MKKDKIKNKKIIINISNEKKELEKYGFIDIYLIKDKYNRQHLLNKKLKVYNVLINMISSTTVHKNYDICKYFYVSENDVLKYRIDDDEIGFYLHVDDCVFVRVQKIKRLFED